MKKISIIGAAGTLGSSCAMTVLMDRYAQELCLIDVNGKLLDNHIMDLENAFPDQQMYRGEYKDLAGSHIVIITAGVPNRNDETSRNAYLADNLKIFETIGSNIAKYSPEAIVVTASNPVDLLNYYLYTNFNFQRSQLIGYTLNDSYRFAWAINKTLNRRDALFSPVIGEHGETQVPLFSQVKKNNKRIEFTSEQIEQIKGDIQGWFVTFNRLNVPRTTGWTTAVGVSHLIKALGKKEKTILTGSVILDEEFEQDNLSIGVPIEVNQNGMQRIVEWNLSETESEAFNQSIRKIKTVIEENHSVFQ